MNIGAHVSVAGGIQNAPERAAELGCECMQIFTRSPQGGKAPAVTNQVCEEFEILNLKFKIKETYVHTPYYINFASTNNRIRYGSVSVVREELERADLIGAKYVMTHLGSAKEIGKEKAFNKTVEMLKKTLDGYAGKTKLLLENSAGTGEIIGNNLKELAEIIKKVDSKSIAGICLDTQHSFASGYDWNDFEKTCETNDKEIGLENIKLIHVNGSAVECNSRKDRHAHLDEGFISQEAFQKITQFANQNNIDLIIETKHDRVKEDVELLKKFRKEN